MTLTGEVGGIKRTENTKWPEELAKFGLEGFTAYDTEHGFTTVILPTGWGVIVKYHSHEGVVEKATPGLLAYCLLNQAARKLQVLGEPLLCLDGEYHKGRWCGINKMNTEERELTLQTLHTEQRREVWTTVGIVDPVWVAEQINQRPELLDGFKF